MNRISSAIVIAAISLAAIFFETGPQGASVRAASTEWLAANALPKHPEKVTAIEVASNGGKMSALDAALVLRAILRYQPKGLAFLAPIAAGGESALLASKLEDAKLPVVFTSGGPLVPLPNVSFTAALPEFNSAGQDIFVPDGFPAGAMLPASPGRAAICARQEKQAIPSGTWRFCMAVENTPPAGVTGHAPGWIQAGAALVSVDAAGCANLNSFARNYVEPIALPQLALQTERSEQGLIGAALDGLFRERLVVVQFADSDSAEAVAALRNRLADLPAPLSISLAVALLAASLPWWSSRRPQRALLALIAGCGLLLLALAIYSEFRLALPLLGIVILPALALIPGGAKPPSNEAHQGKLPA